MFRNHDTATDASSPPPCKLVCFFDFDGTLTSLDGSHTVYSKLYQSLCKSMLAFDYAKATFKDDFVAILRDGLKDDWNKDMRLTEGGKAALTELLSHGAMIYLLSRNRSEYIAAILDIAGIAHNNIRILGINELDKNKGNSTHTILQREAVHADTTRIGIADDSPLDLETMREAARDSGIKHISVCQYLGEAGQFDWKPFLATLSATATLEPVTLPELRL